VGAFSSITVGDFYIIADTDQRERAALGVGRVEDGIMFLG
jgi:hypothetical protein